MGKILLLCLAAVSGFPAQISFGPQPFELSILDSTGTPRFAGMTSAGVTFPQFDPALGRLTQVTYEIRNAAQWSEVEGARMPGWAIGAMLLPGSGAPALLFFDGRRCRGLCGAGDSGTVGDAPDTAIYAGTRTIAAVVTLAAGSGGWRREEVTLDAMWKGEVALVYSYEPQVAAPEPGTLVLALLGLACVLGCRALLKDSVRRESGGGARRGRRSYRRERGP